MKAIALAMLLTTAWGGCVIVRWGFGRSDGYFRGEGYSRGDR
jgi:hypothetical protein